MLIFILFCTFVHVCLFCTSFFRAGVLDILVCATIGQLTSAHLYTSAYPLINQLTLSIIYATSYARIASYACMTSYARIASYACMTSYILMLIYSVYPLHVNYTLLLCKGVLDLYTIPVKTFIFSGISFAKDICQLTGVLYSALSTISLHVNYTLLLCKGVLDLYTVPVNWQVRNTACLSRFTFSRYFVKDFSLPWLVSQNSHIKCKKILALPSGTFFKEGA